MRTYHADVWDLGCSSPANIGRENPARNGAFQLGKSSNVEHGGSSSHVPWNQVAVWPNKNGHKPSHWARNTHKWPQAASWNHPKNVRTLYASLTLNLWGWFTIGTTTGRMWQNHSVCDLTTMRMGASVDSTFSPNDKGLWHINLIKGILKGS